MSNLLHKTVKTSGWRFRRLNGVAVYSVDHNKDSWREFSANPNPTIGEIVDLLVEDFCKRVQTVVTPVTQWINDNPMMPYYLRTFKVECDKLKNDPDKNSVRNAKIPLGTKLKIVGSADRISELTFNVLVLSQRLTDIRSNENFTEYTILGVLPWHRTGDISTVNNEMFVPIESIVLNSEISTLAQDSLAALKDCRFPKIRILPFGDDGVYKRRSNSDDDDNNSEEEEEVGDDQPTAEQLLSFCIRWHVARKGKANSFFEQVIGSSQQSAAKELDDQLFGLTVKYFKETPASEQLFSNRKFFSTIVALWNKNIMPLHNRVWMQRQFSDAIDYIVLEKVISLGSAARLLFVKDVVVSALEYFMPQIVIIRPVVKDFLVIDFFSLGQCSMKLNVCEIVRKFDVNILDSEQPFKIVKGHVYIPISSACRLFGSIMRAAMSRMLNHPDLDVKRQEKDEWLIDDTVMPLRNTDLYVARRTVRYDDFPVDGKVSKNISVSVNSTSQHVDLKREAIAAYNLPEAFGLSDNNISDDGIVDPNASIPLRNSSAVVRVSQSSLNDMCSVSMPDIEDLGNSLQQNPCMSLHNNNAIPLCARSRTSVLVNTSNEYLMWEDRWFLHKFFMSLDLPYVTHEAIAEFMLKNSTTPPLYKKHIREINEFPIRHDKYVRKNIANRAAGSDSNMEQDEYSTSSGSTYLGKCISKYTKGCCPFTKMADGEIDADAKFKQLLVKIQHPLAGKNEAIQRIVDATKRTKNINAGCMQEYVETRNLINNQVVPKAHPDLKFDRPKHYVLACAEYLNRSTQ